MYLSVFLCKHYAINKTGNSANCQSCYSNIGITPGLNDAFESWDLKTSLAMSSFLCHMMTWTLDQSWSPSGHESNQKFSKKAGLEVTFLGRSLWPSIISICVLDPTMFLSCQLPAETSQSRVSPAVPPAGLSPAQRCSRVRSPPPARVFSPLLPGTDWIATALSYLGHRCTLTTSVISACKLSR